MQTDKLTLFNLPFNYYKNNINNTDCKNITTLSSETTIYRTIFTQYYIYIKMNSQNSTHNVHKKEMETTHKKKEQKNVQRKPDNTMEIDEHILRRFDIKKRLGKGAYGIVWKATDRKSKDVVAIKKIFDAFRNQTDAQRTFREIIFLQSFRNHPNIVKLHSIHRASNNNDIYLGFEYMETDLHNVIKRGNILKDVHKRYIMYQMLKATKYIHSGNVIHRDQKPSNVLIDSACRVKLADFGLARSVSSMYCSADEADACLTDYVATRWYRAPEILVASKNYTKGIDMWSLGCILGEMLIGKPLFPGSSTVNQMERIMGALPSPSQEDISAVCTGYGSALIEGEGAAAARGGGVSLSRLLSACPRDAAQLTTQLLVFNPNKRLSADEALRHEYVAKFHREKEETILREDIVLPLRDDRQLSVDDYRNKLYGLMARGGLKTSCSKSQVSSSNSGERNIPSNHNITKTGDTTQHRQTKPKTRPGKPHKASDKNITMSASHSIHVNTVHSESKINHAETKNIKIDNTKSDNALAERNKYERKFNNMIRPLTSDPNFSSMPQNNSKHRQIDSWMTANEKLQGNGDLAHAPKQILTDCSVLSKKNITLGKGKRNSTSYGNITGVDGDNWPSWYKPGFAFNQKHGVITASALSDLRSSIR